MTVHVGDKFESLDRTNKMQIVVTSIHVQFNPMDRGIAAYIKFDGFSESGAKLVSGTTQAEIFFQSYVPFRQLKTSFLQ